MYKIITSIEYIVQNVNNPNHIVQVVKIMNEIIDDIIANDLHDDKDKYSDDIILQNDYLKPHIDKCVPSNYTGQWNNSIRLNIRDAALSVYKHTLLDRSNIMNEHIEPIKSQINNLNLQYKRNIQNNITQN